MESGEFVRIKEFSGAWVVGVLRTGQSPTFPDFVARFLKHRLIRRILPLHQFSDNPTKMLTLLFLCLFSLIQVRVGRRIIDHLCEDDGARRRQWSPRPPEVEGTG